MNDECQKATSGLISVQALENATPAVITVAQAERNTPAFFQLIRSVEPYATFYRQNEIYRNAIEIFIDYRYFLLPSSRLIFLGIPTDKIIDFCVTVIALYEKDENLAELFFCDNFFAWKIKNESSMAIDEKIEQLRQIPDPTHPLRQLCSFLECVKPEHHPFLAFHRYLAILIDPPSAEVTRSLPRLNLSLNSRFHDKATQWLCPSSERYFLGGGNSKGYLVIKNDGDDQPVALCKTSEYPAMLVLRDCVTSDGTLLPKGIILSLHIIDEDAATVLISNSKDSVRNPRRIAELLSLRWFVVRGIYFDVTDSDENQWQKYVDFARGVVAY